MWHNIWYTLECFLRPRENPPLHLAALLWKPTLQQILNDCLFKVLTKAQYTKKSPCSRFQTDLFFFNILTKALYTKSFDKSCLFAFLLDSIVFVFVFVFVITNSPLSPCPKLQPDPLSSAAHGAVMQVLSGSAPVPGCFTLYFLYWISFKAFVFVFVFVYALL